MDEYEQCRHATWSETPAAPLIASVFTRQGLTPAQDDHRSSGSAVPGLSLRPAKRTPALDTRGARLSSCSHDVPPSGRCALDTVGSWKQTGTVGALTARDHAARASTSSSALARLLKLVTVLMLDRRSLFIPDAGSLRLDRSRLQLPASGRSRRRVQPAASRLKRQDGVAGALAAPAGDRRRPERADRYAMLDEAASGGQVDAIDHLTDQRPLLGHVQIWPFGAELRHGWQLVANDARPRIGKFEPCGV